MEITQAGIAQLSMQIEIDASVEKVWDTLTDKIGDWWPADFYAGGKTAARSFAIEAWQFLWNSLKAYAEGKPAPAW